MKRAYIFLTIVGLLFVALAVLFLLFPRSEFSEIERRELKKAPEFSFSRLFDGSYAADVSSWFSDSEPYRDEFMTLSMTLKKNLAIRRPGSDDTQQFVFHQSGDIAADMIPGGDEDDDTADSAADSGENYPREEIPEGNMSAAGDGEARMGKSGTMVVGSGENVRALMTFGGTAASANPYIETVNAYKQALGGDVKVYSMVVPIAIEFYCPEEARKHKGIYTPQLPVIRHIYSSLSPSVRAVNAYTALSDHVNEDIYLRTDHHWAPLGAYYAAREFARDAGVHVPDLSEFDQNVIHRFVGTMYGYSKDISVKNAPENFVYYTPKNQNYTSTFTIMQLDKNFKVTGEGKPYKTQFFKKFKDGTGNAYLTFMGSDFLIVKVDTWVKNGRKLLIIKDSYGNALPGYLFGSFEQVHVVDFRYFPHNIVEYCRKNGITDLLFVNNIFNACSKGVASRTRAMLTRKEGTYSGGSAAEPASSSSSSSGAEKPAAKEPAKPAAKEPTKPVAEEPAKPAAEEPEKPASSSPASAGEDPSLPDVFD